MLTTSTGYHQRPGDQHFNFQKYVFIPACFYLIIYTNMFADFALLATEVPLFLADRCAGISIQLDVTAFITVRNPDTNNPD